MSRIGNRSLVIPDGVTITIDNGIVIVKGPLGELTQKLPLNISVSVEDGKLLVKRENELINTKKLHGTINANIKNLIEGVSKGFEKGLEIIGVGYRFNLKGNVLVINAGYSHPVDVNIPANIKVEQKSNTEILLKSSSKEALGEFAAQVRKVREPEPYKGKGIRYIGEYIRRKEGKKAK